ncbi:MAG: hypothetical protein WA414_05890 [Acidobacteriaceae bacterium]
MDGVTGKKGSGLILVALGHNRAACGDIPFIMKKNRQWVAGMFAVALMAVPVYASPNIYAGQSASQDMKNAGQDTKDAAKDTGKGVKKGTKKSYNASKKGTKKAYHKTKSTTKGAVDGAKAGAKEPQ